MIINEHWLFTIGLVNLVLNLEELFCTGYLNVYYLTVTLKKGEHAEAVGQGAQLLSPLHGEAFFWVELQHCRTAPLDPVVISLLAANRNIGFNWVGQGSGP